MPSLNRVGNDGAPPPRIAGGSGLRDDPISPLACTVRSLDGAMCLSVSGDLDLASVPLLLGHLNRAAEGTANVIIDLSGLRYIDSSGINTLLAAGKIFARKGHQIVLAAASPMMLRLLRIINLEQAMPIFPTVEAALAGLRDGESSGSGRAG